MSTSQTGSVDTTSSESRLKMVIFEVTEGRTDWKAMEQKTGIPAEKWRNLHRGQTKPSIEMFEAVSKRWPKYAFWLATGIPDISHGHTTPARGGAAHRPRERTMAWELFAKMIEYEEWLAAHTPPHGSDDEERQQYYEHEIASLSLLRDDQEKSLEQLEKRELKEEVQARIARGDLPL